MDRIQRKALIADILEAKAGRGSLAARFRRGQGQSFSQNYTGGQLDNGIRASRRARAGGAAMTRQERRWERAARSEQQG